MLGLWAISKSEIHGRFAHTKGMKISVPYSLFPIPYSQISLMHYIRVLDI
ncbi:MAG: hypothetical protein F6K26_19870 [Moorea sp. SIO2I5]|nr:hypothetical protein [Moorena sp. SIO2I5]